MVIIQFCIVSHHEPSITINRQSLWFPCLEPLVTNSQVGSAQGDQVHRDSFASGAMGTWGAAVATALFKGGQPVMVSGDK